MAVDTCRVRRSNIGGARAAPPSKSELIRAVAAATLARGESFVEVAELCDDARAALAVAHGLGAEVRHAPGGVAIQGGSSPRQVELDCAESGTTLRLFAPIAATFDVPCALMARGSLRQRPLAMLEPPLTSLGVRCTTTAGFAPVEIHGPLHGGVLTVDGRETSQLLSGLLLALPTCDAPSVVTAVNLVSKPYVALTLAVARSFGIEIEANAELSDFHIPGAQGYQPTRYVVAGDWSGAAALLVAGAVAGQVTVTGLELDSAQADRAVLAALRAVGARVITETAGVSVAAGELSAFEHDATDCPDLVPVLVALAVAAPGTSILHGADRLTHKESDRATVLIEELGGLGCVIERRGDVLAITGGTVRGGRVDARGDHRIAMAAALVGLRADGPVEIVGAGCVAKSYPGFFEDLAALGAGVDGTVGI